MIKLMNECIEWECFSKKYIMVYDYRLFVKIVYIINLVLFYKKVLEFWFLMKFGKYIILVIF